MSTFCVALQGKGCPEASVFSVFSLSSFHQRQDNVYPFHSKFKSPKNDEKDRKRWDSPPPQIYINIHWKAASVKDHLKHRYILLRGQSKSLICPQKPILPKAKGMSPLGLSLRIQMKNELKLLKEKLRHFKNFKSLFEPLLAWIRQLQVEVVRNAPWTGARAPTLFPTWKKCKSKEIWLAIA